MTLPAKEEVIERESRWLRPAGLVALLGVFLFAAGVIVQQVGLDRTDSDPERLIQFHEHSGQVLAGQVLQGLGIGLFAVPLYVLFKAAEARSERVRGIFAGFCLIGPILFAIASILFAFGIQSAADDFVEQAPAKEQEARQKAEAATKPAEKQTTTTAEDERQTPDEAADDAREDLADDVLDDTGVAKAGASIQVPAILSMLFALVYTCLWGVRTGLLTRFWGSLGMALGVALILLGSFGLLLTVLWFAVLGFRFAGISRRGLPPAWAEGVAIPWEPPGEQGAPPPSDPDAVEGSGRELSEPQLPEEGHEEGEAPKGPPPKKRKRRS